ncbi:S-adenosyl-L-methionine-dependent methyltransferase, partial [Piptocephalis cylindrospora]
EEAHRMITPDQGQFLRMIVRSTRAQTVMELGCFTGYAAAWMADGLVDPEGRVFTCERDDQYSRIAQTWLDQGGWTPRVTVMDSSSISLPRLIHSILDANKASYIKHLDIILNRHLLAPHALILADNVLFRGLVKDINMNDRTRVKGPARAMDRFNKYVRNHPLLDSVILDVFDGISLIQYKQ